MVVSGEHIENYISQDAPSVEGFWNFCLERDRIRQRKERGEPQPWTTDRLLKRYHFCNIRREDDYGTRWYVENVGSPTVSDIVDLLWKTILYRVVNNIQWFEQVGGVFSLEQWRDNSPQLHIAIENASPPYSLAYKVLQSPDGRPRKEHLLQHITWLETNIDRLTEKIYNAETLEDVWNRLQTVPFVGPFISLQVYRDLILVGALPFNDNDFTYLGPGCRQGMRLIFPEISQYQQQYWALQEMRELHPPELELSLGDVEQSVCEHRKYLNLKSGGGRHRFYKPHGK